ncbi:nicotinamide-nucleotide amidase [Erwinia tasmaniensis]|uniref:Probable competence-damaged protein n=1 Tax=Erwinia tasmaniensis (strain DSM 17950 / CFBP 7177 / CIP 109463 / NCPPB 4357 / Et1/99) TaxID=465817 RepID=B2VHD7_ERWT9|nr:nicotinamide-nucleotide amidase [Erwinia tasmaniensis]CAO97715.1 Probable competence-damaged protein [Erwinia tasmaniensis Et1/99]
MTDNELTQLSTRIGQLLLARNASVTTAESCTGGWVAKVLTDIAGSSAWFQRGFVTYSDTAKQQMIGVTAQSLAQFGAVSSQVVSEMALGALHEAGSQYAVSVSGIAGPDGGSEEKPVGTVWFGFASVSGEVLTLVRCFSGDREAVRRQATGWVLQTLHDHFLRN